ncbi:prepilin peptidase [Nocardiopsis sediminis]|uniref:Prepilin peptidase n=1 Tax=Nocardiopsis sediminis TaxID=1778267 RepID=A0ABV8FRB8_9ACTN
MVDFVLAAVLALIFGGVGVPIGRAAGRLVPLFPRHDPDPGDDGPPPPPTCPHCGAEIPFVSWLPGLSRVPGFWKHGRCPACAQEVRPSAAVAWGVPIVFAVAGALVIARPVEPDIGVPALLFLLYVGVVLTVIDARVQRLPNVLVLPSYPVAVLLVLYGTFAPAPAYEPATGPAYANLVTALIGMAALAAFYWLLWFIYPAGMGWGDVKLAGLLGLYMGWGGLGGVVSGAFLTFLCSAAFGLTLMALGRAGRKTQIPLGPFMIGAAFVVVLFGDPAALLP